MIEQFAPIRNGMVTLPNGSIMPLKLAARGQRGWGMDRSDSETERLERVRFAEAVRAIEAALAQWDAMGAYPDQGDFVECLVEISDAWPVVAAWIKGGKEE